MRLHAALVRPARFRECAEKGLRFRPCFVHCDFPKWWSFLTYDGLKSHVNVTDALKKIQRRGSRLVRRRLVQVLSNQAYDKFQAKQDKAQTRNILELAWWKVHGHINQCQLIIIISTAIQNIPAKVCTY